jgi:hypothetical protein
MKEKDYQAPSHRWEDTIKTELKWKEGEDWINLA